MEAGGGKHWTKAQKEARKKADSLTKRASPRSINAPAWLKKPGMKSALRVWNRVITSAKDMELLDNLDTEILATYCLASGKIEETSSTAITLESIKELQAWARIQKTCADGLGFTPAARAKLVKKKADEIEKNEFEKEFGT